MKSYWVALFWLIVGGPFGLHHFYLGRIDHGIIYLFTFGGFCGFGVLHDLFGKLRYYVKWENFDADFKEEYIAKIRKDPVPKMNVGRGIALTFVPQMFGYLVTLAVPPDFIHPVVYSIIVAITVPLAVGFSVWLVGSVGEIQGSLTESLKGAYLALPLYLFDLTNSNDMFCSLISGYFFRRSWSYRLRPKTPPSFGRSVFYVAAFLTVTTLLFSSMVAFNCTVSHEGESMECRQLLKNIYNSPLWQKFRSSLSDTKRVLFERGFSEAWNYFILLFDFDGTQHAYQVLGLPKSSSFDDARKIYRKLSRNYHPDKNQRKSKEEREYAERMYNEVQEAFEKIREATGHLKNNANIEL